MSKFDHITLLVTEKINADVKQIQAAVEGLAYFFIEASQNEVSI